MNKITRHQSKRRTYCAVAPTTPPQQNERRLIESLIALIEEWERQKRLFPVLEQDGWMDLKIREASLIIAKVEGRE